jgi:hypothetical protein
MSYLRYSCWFAYGGVQHILCCVFALFFFVLCTLCCQYTQGEIKNGLSRETGNIGYIRRRKTKQKHNTICVGHHHMHNVWLFFSCLKSKHFFLFNYVPHLFLLTCVKFQGKKIDNNYILTHIYLPPFFQMASYMYFSVIGDSFMYKTKILYKHIDQFCIISC